LTSAILTDIFTITLTISTSLEFYLYMDPWYFTCICIYGK